MREAFQQLESDGLAVRQQGRLVVAGLTLTEATNIHLIRLSLEKLAIRQAMAGDRKKLARQLEKTLHDMRYELLGGDTMAAVGAARAFHEIIYQMANNEMLERFLMQVYNRVDQYRFSSSVQGPPRLHHTDEEHERIIAAVRDGNVDTAENEIATHLQSAHDFLISAMSKEQTA